MGGGEGWLKKRMISTIKIAAVQEIAMHCISTFVPSHSSLLCSSVCMFSAVHFTHKIKHNVNILICRCTPYTNAHFGVFDRFGRKYVAALNWIFFFQLVLRYVWCRISLRIHRYHFCNIVIILWTKPQQHSFLVCCC